MCRRFVVLEEIMSTWSNLVYIRIGTGNADVITGPSDALAALTNRWPAGQGRHFVDAKRLCRMAVAGDVSAEVAREAFIAAALEAAVLNERLWPSGHTSSDQAQSEAV
jgi:hypothetical protein